MYTLKLILTAAVLTVFAVSAHAQSQSQQYRDYVNGKVSPDRDPTTREALDTGTF